MTQDTTKIDAMPKGSISLAELAGDIVKNTRSKAPRASQKAQDKRNTFPLEVLPLKAQELVKGAKTALGIPPDILATSMLFAAAAAAGNTIAEYIGET